MAKHLQLTIADPCHEDWDKMSPTQKGRFCDSCQKQVVDFTGMTDAQLVAFFKKEATGSVCGRFYNDQLDKSIAVPRKRIPWVKYFFQLTLPLFLASLKSNAQKGKVAVKQPDTENVCIVTAGMVRPVSDLGIQEPLPVPKKIRGLILTEEGKPVPYASIMIEGTTKGAAADNTGLFTLSVPEKAKELKLQVSSVGFNSSVVVIRKKDIERGEIIKIHLIDEIILPEVEVVGYPPIRCSRVTGSVTRVVGKIIPETIDSNIIRKNAIIVPAISPMKVFPNPAQAGSAVSIEIGKMEEGYYSFSLLNITGQLILQKEIYIDNEARLLNMPVPTVASGTYFINMINKKSGKKSTEKFIIH